MDSAAIDLELKPNTFCSLDQLNLLLGVLLVHISEFCGLSNLQKPAFMVLFAFSLITRSWNAAPSLLLLLLMYLYGLLPEPLRGLPILGFLAPFLFFAVIVSFIPKIKHPMTWLSPGQVDAKSKILVAATGLLSTLALILWAFWTDNLGMASEMAKGLSSLHIPKLLVLTLIVPTFALLNALAEELVFRGVIQEGLARAFKSNVLVIALQASAFAAVHYSAGFPNGLAGYLMVFTYGMMLGYLRARTGGILASYAAHVIADLTIGSFLAFKFI